MKLGNLDVSLDGEKELQTGQSRDGQNRTSPFTVTQQLTPLHLNKHSNKPSAVLSLLRCHKSDRWGYGGAAIKGEDVAGHVSVDM